MATRILDVDLADGPPALDVPDGYRSALILLRWRGRLLVLNQASPQDF